MYGLNVYDHIVLDAAAVDDYGTSGYLGDTENTSSEEGVETSGPDETEEVSEEASDDASDESDIDASSEDSSPEEGALDEASSDISE
jgi:hypothetical protein